MAENQENSDRKFTLIKNDNGKTSERVISIKVRKHYNQFDGSCEHNNVVIDEGLWRIECEDCKELLDPIQYLVNIAKEENLADYRLHQLQIACAELEKKTRTKCQHCGKMTHIYLRSSYD